MRKAILLFALTLLPFIVGAQTKNITIDWGDSHQTGFNTKNPSVSQKGQPSSVLNLELTQDAVIYRTQWIDTQFADKNSAVVSNVRYGSISSEELKK
jgi:hypothetical protein